MSTSVRITALFAAFCFGTAAIAEDFGVEYIVGKVYPSLTPKKVLRVKVGDSDAGTDLAWTAPQSPSCGSPIIKPC